MTPTAALLGHTVPDDKYGTAELATDAILILSKGCPAASTIAGALADAGMTASLATPAMVETGVRSGGIAVVVITGAALRSLDIDMLVAALADQPPGLEAMIIGIDTDGDDLAQRLARLDAATTLVPIGPPTAATMAIHIVRASLRARRRHRDCGANAMPGAEAASATRRLAEAFDARVEQGAAQRATEQENYTLASERLSEIDERNRAVEELTDLILFTTDADGMVTKIDDRLFAVTGYPRDRSMSIGSDKPGVHPDDRERVRALQIASRGTGKPVDYVYRILVADGSYRWWHLRARPVFNAEGNILRWNGILADIHDRKVAEEQLRESELRHRASIALSHLITFTLDADGQLDDIDDRICELTGLSMPELLANAPDGLCHPDDLPVLVRLRDEALETRSYDQTVRIRHAGGDYKWWRLRAAPRLAADGATIGWFGTMEDVNRLVIARERLEASEEIHRFSVELSDQVVWSAAADGTIASIGDGLFDRLGIARDVWMAMSRAERVHPDDFERVSAINLETVKNGKSADYRFRMRCGDGSYRWWRSRFAPLVDVDGRVIRWHGMLEDVDALARAEEKLRESEERYRFAIQMSNLVTYTMTRNGRIEAMDSITANATGFSIGELVSKGSDFTWHPDHLAAIQAARVEAAVTGHYDQTHLMDNRDGTYRWWRSRAAAYRDADGKIVRWHGTLENVDELKRAEERLRESENRHRFCIGLSKLVTYTATTDAIIETIDATITTATGIDTADIIGTLPTSFCYPDDVDGLVEALLSARQLDIFDHSYRIRDAVGKYRWWRSRSQPHRDEAGNIVRWYGTMEDIDDLHRAEERLRESENRHRFCIGLSKLITYTTTSTATIDSIDDGIFAAIGIRASDIVGGTPMRGCHPDDRAGLKAAYARAAVTGAFDHCYRMSTADGSYRWWRSRSQPRRDEAGNIVRWYGTLEDIDDLRRAEERLRESEELHRFSVELSNQVVWTGTPEGRLLSVGPNLLEKLGLTSGQWLQQQPEQRVHPDDIEAANMARRHSIKAGVPANFQCRLLHGDGDYHWWRIRAAPRLGVDGAVIRWYGTLEDIDELKRAGERLRETEELYRYTVELGEQIVFTASAAGKITSIGARWTQVTDLSADAVLGDGIFALFHPDDRADVANRWTMRVADGLGADLVCRIANASGEYRWWRIRAAQRQGAAGDVIGWYGTLEDIDAATRAEHKLKQVQAEMVHMSRVNAMGTMASTLAHELNQPLAAVINYISGSRRLLDDTSGPSIQRVGDAMRKAQDCAFRASEIIRRVRMQVSRGDGHQSIVTAGSLVQDACNIALINARELGINLVVDLDPAATSVYGDNIQFQQILINLLRNAAEAVSGQAERRIVVSTRLAGSYLAFAVDDSGPGVAKSMEARLFEPFESSKPSGMGIGLSISRTIAESHGGRLEYEPSVLGGARFTILLPKSTEPEHSV